MLIRARKTLLRIINYKFLFLLLFLESQSFAEAFGNNSLTIPKVGMSFFDSPILIHQKPWGINRQWTAGTSFMQAINYRFWWVVETSIGIGQLTVGNRPNVGTFCGGAGLRFNIFQDDFRPHVGLMLHYLQFIGDGAKSIPLNLGWPIFIGLKPYAGMEWLFYSEMALILDGGYGFYVNINEPFRQALYANASFAIYF